MQFCRRPFPSILASCSLLVLIFLTSGCGSKKISQDVISPLPLKEAKAFSAAGSEPLPQLWWQAFDDPQLNRRIELALANNFSLTSAWYRLSAARALVRFRAADQNPQLHAAISARTTSDDSADQLLSGLEADYEVDLWGRINSLVAAEQYRAQATEADFQTAAITISAEMTTIWFRLLEANQQLVLINSQIATNQQVVDLLKARLGIGLVSSADVLRQQQLIETTKAEKLNVETDIALLQQQLAVLEGRPPQHVIDLKLNGLELPALPPIPQVGLPADLVRQRPDVQSAFFLLRAADSELAAAVRDQYPNLTLTGSINTAARSASTLFIDWVSSLAASLIAPLYDGGGRQAQVDRATALKQEQLNSYAQTVLQAFLEVEDALLRERKQRERIANIEERLDLAMQTRQQLQLEYFNGVSAYISVLTALTDEQRLQRDLLVARRNLLEYRISLYRALAGGLSLPQLQRDSEQAELVETNER